MFVVFFSLKFKNYFSCFNFVEMAIGFVNFVNKRDDLFLREKNNRTRSTNFNLRIYGGTKKFKEIPRETAQKDGGGKENEMLFPFYFRLRTDKNQRENT